LGGFILWWLVLPPVSSVRLALIKEAFAATGQAGALDPKPLIYIGIFVMLFCTFLVSVWVNYFGKTEKAADQTGTVAKTLLGFFIGAATNYLGIATT
jgi:hypothetical protein